MNLQQISRPMTVSLWIIGHGVIEIPLGRPRKLLSILYASFLFILYCYVVFYVTDKMDLGNFAKTNDIGLRMYRLVSHLNIGIIVFMDILSWTRKKDLDVYFVRMNTVIKVMERLGMKDDYRRHLQFQYFHCCVLCLDIMISSACMLWFIGGLSVNTKLLLSYGFFYPIVTLHVPDIYFVNSVRYIGTKFEQLNEILSDRLKTLSKVDGTDEHSEENLCNLIKSVRQIHLELMRLSKHFNQILDVQLLISITITVTFNILNILNIYNILMGMTFEFETSLRMTGLTTLFIFNFFKIFTVGQTCGSTSAAAQKTGGIVFKFYDFERSKETRGEIEEFTMQLIQNPVWFTAYDFLTLDYSFIFQVTATVTTYVIIFIQMNSTMVDLRQVNATVPTEQI